MKVKMSVVFFDKDKKMISDYNNQTKKAYFKFQLNCLRQAIYCDNDFGDELRWEIASALCLSDFKEFKDGLIHNYSFSDYTWGLRVQDDYYELFLYNNVIEI